MKYNGIEVKDYERLDDLHRAGLQLIQDPKRFCFGVDAVLLSGFARILQGERVLDLGTGTGVIPILLSAKSQGASFTGLEIQAECVAMARRSVALNGLEGQIEIIEGDIKTMDTLFKGSSFDCITVNPPYMNSGGGLLNEYSPKAIARHELLCSLEDVVRGCAKTVRPGGRVYMIHRPHRLVDILSLCRQYKLEPKTLRFVHPYRGREPNMVLIEAVRGGNPMVQVRAPLVIYEDQSGAYTQEVYQIYYE